MPVIKNLEIYEAYKDNDCFKEGSKPGQIKHRVRLCGWFMTRFYSDLSWYGCCQCGYIYQASRNEIIRDVKEIKYNNTNLKIYWYCPSCGRKKRRNNR